MSEADQNNTQQENLPKAVGFYEAMFNNGVDTTTNSSAMLGVQSGRRNWTSKPNGRCRRPLQPGASC